jgi:hypothetical protein
MFFAKACIIRGLFRILLQRRQLRAETMAPGAEMQGVVQSTQRGPLLAPCVAQFARKEEETQSIPVARAAALNIGFAGVDSRER